MLKFRLKVSFLISFRFKDILKQSILTFTLYFDFDMCFRFRFWKVIYKLIWHVPLQFYLKILFKIRLLECTFSFGFERYLRQYSKNPLNFYLKFYFKLRVSKIVVRVTLALIEGLQGCVRERKRYQTNIKNDTKNNPEIYQKAMQNVFLKK